MSGGIVKNRFRVNAIAMAILIGLVSNVHSANATSAAVSTVKQTVAPTVKTNIPVSQSSSANTDEARNVVIDPYKLGDGLGSLTQAYANKKTKSTPKKVVKSKTQVIDAELVAWSSKASTAEAHAHRLAQKVVGSNGTYLTKSTTFVVDSSKVIAQVRISFKSEIPETWYMEAEMVTGFASTYERAYEDALNRASGKAEKIQSTADWTKSKSSAKNGSDRGIIPYSIVFETVSNEICCKLYFRYFLPK